MLPFISAVHTGLARTHPAYFNYDALYRLIQVFSVSRCPWLPENPRYAG